MHAPQFDLDRTLASDWHPATRRESLHALERMALTLLRAVDRTRPGQHAVPATVTPARAPGSRATAALVTLAGALHRSPLSDFALLECAHPWVSPVEYDLLTALAHSQRGADIGPLTHH